MATVENWQLLGEGFTGENPEDGVGYSVALNAEGDVVAIGCPLYDFGSAKVFTFYIEGGGTGAVWHPLGTAIDGDGNSENI